MAIAIIVTMSASTVAAQEQLWTGTSGNIGAGDYYIDSDKTLAGDVVIGDGGWFTVKSGILNAGNHNIVVDFNTNTSPPKRINSLQFNDKSGYSMMPATISIPRSST